MAAGSAPCRAQLSFSCFSSPPAPSVREGGGGGALLCPQGVPYCLMTHSAMISPGCSVLLAGLSPACPPCQALCLRCCLDYGNDLCAAYRVAVTLRGDSPRSCMLVAPAASDPQATAMVNMGHFMEGDALVPETHVGCDQISWEEAINLTLGLQLPS